MAAVAEFRQPQPCQKHSRPKQKQIREQREIIGRMKAAVVKAKRKQPVALIENSRHAQAQLWCQTDPAVLHMVKQPEQQEANPHPPDRWDALKQFLQRHRQQHRNSQKVQQAKDNQQVRHYQRRHQREQHPQKKEAQAPLEIVLRVKTAGPRNQNKGSADAQLPPPRRVGIKPPHAGQAHHLGQIVADVVGQHT